MPSLDQLVRTKSTAILLSFLTTFILARLVVFLSGTNWDIEFLASLAIGGHHIHHFAYGITILTLNNFILLFIPHRYSKGWLYVLYGIGLGLIFDEFGIWLNLDPNYHQIVSVIAVIVVSVLLFFAAIIESTHKKFYMRMK